MRTSTWAPAAHESGLRFASAPVMTVATDEVSVRP